MNQSTIPSAHPPVQRKIEPLLNVNEVARRLGIGKTKAYKLMNSSLPSIRLGPGTLRVRESDLEKFIDKLVDHHEES